MKHFFALALVGALIGCSTVTEAIAPPDTPMPVIAAGVVIETAATWRLWELLGYVKWTREHITKSPPCA